MKGDTVAQKNEGESLETLREEVSDAIVALPKVDVRAKDALLIGEGYTALARSLHWALQSNLPDATTRAALDALQSRVWHQLSRIELDAAQPERELLVDETVIEPVEALQAKDDDGIVLEVRISQALKPARIGLDLS